MAPPLTAHLRRLLQARDTTAAQAIIARAHNLATEGELTTALDTIEAQLEAQLPINVWRRAYPQWVIEDVMRSHDPAHPQPKHCPICATKAANQPRRLRQSA